MILKTYTKATKAAMKSCGKTWHKPHFTPGVNVENIRPHSTPWTVAFCVRKGGNYSALNCLEQGQGSIVGKRWVLSFSPLRDPGTNTMVKQKEIAYIKAGAFNLTAKELQSNVYKIKAIHSHPRAGFFKHKGYDIALYELETDVEFTDCVQPICLPEDDKWLKRVNGTVIHVIGWNHYKLTMNPALQQSYATVINWNLLPRVYFSVTKPLHYKMISGAQLVNNRNGTWFQYGIFAGSFIYNHQYYGNFGRVGSFCAWIKSMSRNEVQCQPE
ncbi:trypsin domain-containing protein [Ditylenchus destructor]|uniref:Trypsin domain-containing protein n=1 Tax=Ditylenchus destructor TaxID=166010 RepID=A0AAD4MH75_9BILA|nr:trypsin domain-containing protein [Ditylenchus destructor]